jgi:hypothetical protein
MRGNLRANQVGWVDRVHGHRIPRRTGPIPCPSGDPRFRSAGKSAGRNNFSRLCVRLSGRTDDAGHGGHLFRRGLCILSHLFGFHGDRNWFSFPGLHVVGRHYCRHCRVEKRCFILDHHTRGDNFSSFFRLDLTRAREHGRLHARLASRSAPCSRKRFLRLLRVQDRRLSSRSDDRW